MSSTVGEEFSSPEKKLGIEKATCDGDMLDPSLNYGGGSYDLVIKEGSAISSSITSPSESESESDFFVKRSVLQEVNSDFAGMQDKMTKFDSVTLDVVDDGNLVEKMKDDMNKILLEKVGKYELELKVANKVIQTSQEEISKLKFEASYFDVTKLEDYENKILELQNTIARLEVSLRDSDESNVVLKKELNSTDEVVRALEADLGSERRTVCELPARVDASANDLTNCNQEIQELNFALSKAHESFSNERSCWLSEMSVLSEQRKCLQKKLDTAELDTNQLKNEMNVLNKSFDASKFKYDMVTAEKDELNAQVNCGSIRIEQMERQIIELEEERRKLMYKVEDGERMATGLRLKVAKLENEAEMQRGVISERAEEKREAIRQLCFSLEYYRSEYNQLCRAFGGLKRHPLMVPLS